MVRMAVQVNQRNAQVAQMARQWQQRYGRLDRPNTDGMSFFDKLSQWTNSYPLFGAR
jgi:hypothetical protein